MKLEFNTSKLESLYHLNITILIFFLLALEKWLAWLGVDTNKDGLDILIKWLLWVILYVILYVFFSFYEKQISQNKFICARIKYVLLTNLIIFTIILSLMVSIKWVNLQSETVISTYLTIFSYCLYAVFIPPIILVYLQVFKINK